MSRRESSLERTWNKEAAKCGFLSLKLVAVANNGFPDRTNIGKGQHIFFVELKREGEKPRANQRRWHRLLKRLGFRVYVIDTIEKIRKCLEHEVSLINAK